MSILSSFRFFDFNISRQRHTKRLLWLTFSAITLIALKFALVSCEVVIRHGLVWRIHEFPFANILMQSGRKKRPGGIDSKGSRNQKRKDWKYRKLCSDNTSSDSSKEDFSHQQRKASHQVMLLEQWLLPTCTISQSSPPQLLTSAVMETGVVALSASMVVIAIWLLASTGLLQGVEGSIGVNYGTVADNLPPPSEVAHFLLESTIINRVRFFDADSQLLQAFANTGIAVTVTVPNDQIPQLTKLSFAQQWLKLNIQPYIPATNVVCILVGNEVIATANKGLIGSLVPAMQTLHTALVAASLDRRIKVSTPHSLGILSNSSPPSSGRFRQGYDTHLLKPMLSFLRATNSPFMVNPYPFFGCSSDTLDYALFRPNSGVFDENTKLLYTNMLDAQLDAVFSAMKLLGFTDVEIVIAETGWPSQGDSSQVGVDAESAAEYNKNLMQHVNSGAGTPLMRNRTFDTYIFALFNEDLKPGPTCERHFGLFQPDMTPVYDIGILRPTARSSIPGTNPTPVPMAAPAPVSPMPGSTKERQWCLPKAGADTEALQSNIDYVCGLGLDCGPIQQGGECFLPNTVSAHAAFAMNAYYQVMGKNDYDCDFRQTGAITNVDPSYGNCKY